MKNVGVYESIVESARETCGIRKVGGSIGGRVLNGGMKKSKL